MSDRDAYREKAEARLELLDARISALKAKAKAAKADVEIKYNEQIEKLNDRRADARARLDELAQKGEEAWQEVKAGVEQAFGELQGAIDAAAARLES